MKCVSSDDLALFTRVYFFQKSHFLLVNALAAFELRDPAKPLPGGKAWEALAKARPGKVLDMGLPKPAAEFLAEGDCHVPGGVALHSCPVSIRVGELTKTLTVLGDREWVRRKDCFAAMSDPAPFTSMPLTWERAFGGPGHSANKVGTGFLPPGQPCLDERTVMPNVEYPGGLFLSPLDQPVPAGFGAERDVRIVDPKRFGTYDEAWLAEEWPAVAGDVDPGVNAWAPHDQRLTGFFRGDETLEIVNMRPDAPVIDSRLPGRRARFLIRTAAWREARVNYLEIAAQLDTVWLFPGQGLGVCVWRGWHGVTDEEASIVRRLAAVSEDLAAPPRPLEDYRPLLDEPASPAAASAPTAPPEAASPEAAPPEATPPEAASPQAAPAATSPGDAGLAELMAGMRKEMEEVFASRGLSLDLLAKSPGEVETTLSGLLDRGAAQAAERLQGLGLIDETPDLAGADGYEAALASVKQTAANIGQSVEKLRARLGVSEAAVPGTAPAEAPDPETLNKVLSAMGLGPAALERIGKGMAEVEAAVEATWRRLKPETASEPAASPAPEPQPPKPPEPPRSRLDREAAIARRQSGQSLAGLDLTGIDLSGLDLSGVDLSGSLLERAALSGTNLSGADLSGAILTGATAAGALFDRCRGRGLVARGLAAPGASLREADFSQARLAGADLGGVTGAGAELSGADLSGAVLDGADFSGCRAIGTLFVGASARKAGFVGASLEQADLGRAVLSGADLSGTAGRGARFTETAAPGASFRGALLPHSRSTGGGAFSGADFSGADLTGAVWLGGDFDRADFLEARLNQGRFDGGRFGKARLVKTTAREAAFNKTDLTEADLRGADLFQAALRHARLIGARLDGASLFGADLFKAELHGASLERADVGRTRLAWREPLRRPS